MLRRENISKTDLKISLAFLLIAVVASLPYAVAQEKNQEPRDAKARELEEKANKLLQLRKNDEAIVEFKKAVEIEPGSASLHFGLGIAYSNKFLATRNKSYEEKSLGSLQRCLELNPAQRGVYLAMGRMAFANKKYEEAAALAGQEIKTDPAAASAYRLKWDALLKRADFEKELPPIRGEIETLLRSDISREDALYAALLGYEAIADKEARIKVEDTILKEYPASLRARIILRDRAMSEPDKKKQSALIADFITRFPDDGSIGLMYPMLFRGLAANPDEQGERIDKIGRAWIKSVSSIHDVVASRWAFATVLAERGINLESAQLIADEGVKITDGLDNSSASLSGVRESERQGFISMLKERAHAARGFVLLRRGKIEEASRELDFSLRQAINQVEKNGYILWKDMWLREIGARPGVLWLAELYEAQGEFERAAKFLLAGFGDNEQSNKFIRDRLPEVYRKLGRDPVATAAALSAAERRYNSLTTISPAMKEEARKRIVSARVAKPAPDFKVTTIDKRVLRLSDLRGKVIVLNFWATWCGPCVDEMPQLARAASKYKRDPDVVFLTISIDENKVAVRAFLDANRYTMIAAYDDGAADSFGVSGIPATFILDRDGVIQFNEEGFNRGDSDYVERLSWRVDELLKEKSGTASVK